MPRKERKALKVEIRQMVERVGFVNALHREPDQEKLFYRTYSIAYSFRPEEFFPWHLCMNEQPNSSPVYIKFHQVVCRSSCFIYLFA